MLKKIFVLVSVLAFGIIVSCIDRNNIRTDSASEVVLSKVDSDKARNMLSVIENINKNRLDTFSVSYDVLGRVKAKKYKVTGSAKFNRKGPVLHAVFKDYIFKSIVASVFQDGSKLAFYYPSQKRLIYDNSKSINIKNYVDFDIEYNLLFDLVTGKFPVIKGAVVSKVFESKDGKAKGLILKTPEYYESVFFKDNFPEKIKIINRLTGDAVEVYLKRFIKINNSYYFNRLKVVVKKNDLDINVSFSSIKINNPVRVNKINKLVIKPGVKVIRIN